MPCGPPRPLWAGPLWAPLGLCGPCPCGRMCARPWWAPWALVGRALVGPPWALMGWAIIGHSGRPIYKHMHIHMHMHVYVYIVYIYICMYTCVYIYIYIYIYIFVHMYTYMLVSVGARSSVLCTRQLKMFLMIHLGLISEVEQSSLCITKKS